MRKTLSAIALFMCALTPLMPSGAAAQNCLVADPSASQIGDLAYDPAEGVPLRISLEVRADVGPGPICEATPVAIETRIGSTFSLTHGGAVLPSSFTRSQDFAAVASNRLEFTPSVVADLLNSGIVQIDLLTVAPGQFASPGLYQLELDLVLSDGRTLPFAVAIEVQPSVILLSSDGNQDIFLGEVSNGASVAVQFFFRTNASLAVSARSTNDGALMHEAGPDFGTIPYDAFISGEPLELGDLTGVNLSGAAGAMQAGEVRVDVSPQAEQRYSGRYTDTLTLTLTAN